MKKMVHAQWFAGMISASFALVVVSVAHAQALVNLATPGSRPPTRFEKILLEDIFPLIVLYIILTVPTWVASVMARSKSWWTGGIIGSALGLGGGYVLSSTGVALWGASFLGVLGLIFDHTISTHYQRRVRARRHPSWWAGGPIGFFIPYSRSWKQEHFFSE